MASFMEVSKMEDNTNPNFSDTEGASSSADKTRENNSESSEDVIRRGRELFKLLEGAKPNAQSHDPRDQYWAVCEYSYTHGNLHAVPIKVLYMLNLRSIDLSHNSIAVIPSEFRMLTFLQVLNLSHNYISTLPDPFIQTSLLKTLNLSHNRFTEVPRALYNSLPCVRNLDLSNNYIDDFPNPPLCCNSLQMLDLGFNRFTHIPRWMFDYELLKMIDFNNNSLADIPPNFLHEQPYAHYSKNVQVMNLQNCGLTGKKINFLSSILDLETLILGNTIDVTKEYRNSLPVLSAPTISGAMSLKFLVASNVDMFILHNNSYSFRNIQYLDLSYNNLMWLPNSFCDLTSLIECKLNSNFLHFLPDNIGKLSNLEKIYLNDNNLVQLPATFKFLSKLEICDLYDNMLETIDSEIIKLKSLKGIDLGDNCLVLDQLFNENFVEILETYWSLKETYRTEMRFDRSDIQDQRKLKNDLKQRRVIRNPDFIASATGDVYCLRIETQSQNRSLIPTTRFGHYKKRVKKVKHEDRCRRVADIPCSCKTCRLFRVIEKKHDSRKSYEKRLAERKYDSDSDSD